TAFQDYAGVASLDMGFKAAGDSAYHYHSNYDSFHWMSEFADPGFAYHRVMAQVLGLMVGELAGKPVVPFNATVYADEMGSYLDKVERALNEEADEAALVDEEEAVAAYRGAKLSSAHKSKGDVDAFRKRLEHLRKAVRKLR